MELIKDFKGMWKGVLFCLIVAVPAWLLGKRFEVVGGPVFAILIGMVLALAVPARAGEPLQRGVKFTSKKILQYAVILLGFGLNLAQIAQVGATSVTQMGKVMGVVTKKLAGRADGKDISAKVRELLS